MDDPLSITFIAGTFLLAGTVKGIVGLGLPSIALGLLTVAFDLHTAMVLLIVPSLVTNLWQAVAGGNGGAIVVRLWPFLVPAIATVGLGAMALSRAQPALLMGLLGSVLMAYAVLSLVGLRFTIPAQREIWLGPLLGAANGVLTGMTGSFVMPSVLFLQAIGLPRDKLVQAMGIVFTSSTLALALALQHNQLLTLQYSTVSVAAVLPAALGMRVGQRIRQRLAENHFRRVFFCALFMLGAYIFVKAVAIVQPV